MSHHNCCYDYGSDNFGDNNIKVDEWQLKNGDVAKHLGWWQNDEMDYPLPPYFCTDPNFFNETSSADNQQSTNTLKETVIKVIKDGKMTVIKGGRTYNLNGF